MRALSLLDALEVADAAVSNDSEDIRPWQRSNEELNRFKDAVNAAKVNYNARGVNSNSFAFDAAKGLTGTRPVPKSDPGNNALGSDITTGVQFEPQGPNQ